MLVPPTSGVVKRPFGRGAFLARFARVQEEHPVPYDQDYAREEEGE